MKKPAIPSKLLDKRIPTLLGIFVLVVALIAGTLLLGKGPGVFAPRATPTTTPKNIKVTNVTDNSFTISFLTDDITPGFVKYGTTESALNSQASDDRDQLSGTVADFKMHHITVRGLQPTTNYYYTLGTGAGTSFDNNGMPFLIKTAARNGAPAAAKTIYGSVSNQTGSPADGSVVYIALANAGEMSSLVKASGSWAVPLSNARTKDGSGYAQISDVDNIIISVQGPTPTEIASLNTTVADAQPVPTLKFGQTTPPAGSPTPLPTQTATPEATIEATPEPTPTPEVTPEPSATPETVSFFSASPSAQASGSAAFLGGPRSSNSVTTVDLEKTEPQQVNTTQPTIIGKAAPNVTVTIEVHSDTNIQQFVTADANGNFSLDIAALSKTLEPGPHTATYSYTDPTTGQVITKTVNFVVEPAAQQLAQTQPFGSGNPFPPTTPTPTPTPTPASASATASPSATATDSGRTSMPATGSGVPVSGSVGTTLALIFGGLFFIISGLWSFWISHQLGKEEVEF